MSAVLPRALARRICVAALAAGAASLAACGTQRFIDSAQRASMDESDVAAMGREAHQEMVKARLIYQDEKLAAYVSRVGNRVATAAQQRGADSALIFRYFVIDDDDVNAFAAPGGYIYITRGLLALLKTEDELAAVLGHETAHVAAGHILKQNAEAGRAGMLSALGSMGLSVLGVLTFNPILLGLAGAGDTAGAIGTGLYEQKYSRQLELEADSLGKSYAAAGGYDPRGEEQVLLALQSDALWAKARADARGIKPQPSWGVFASHPDNAVRLSAVRAVNVTGVRRAPEGDYLAALDGLVFGLSDRIGVQRGNYFYSQTHNLVLSVPSGWFVSQSPDDQAALLIAPKNTARIVLISQDLAKREDAAGFAAELFKGDRLQGKTRNVGTYLTWRGTVQTGRLAGQPMQAMTWTEADRGFAILGVNDRKSPISESAWQGIFDKVSGSLRPLQASEKELAQSIKVRIQAPGKKPLQYAALAKDAPLGADAVAVLRVMNGQYGTSAEPAPGQRVKVLR